MWQFGHVQLPWKTAVIFFNIRCSAILPYGWCKQLNILHSKQLFISILPIIVYFEVWSRQKESMDIIELGTHFNQCTLIVSVIVFGLLFIVNSPGMLSKLFFLSFSILFRYHPLVLKGLSEFPKSLIVSRTCQCMWSMPSKELQLGHHKIAMVFSSLFRLIWNRAIVLGA